MSYNTSMFKKYGFTSVITGIWNKEEESFITGKEILLVVKRLSKPFTYTDPEWNGSYANGDGGYIKGKGIKKTAQKEWFFCYTSDGELKGFINPYNVMFRDRNRYQLYLINTISSRFNLEE